MILKELTDTLRGVAGFDENMFLEAHHAAKPPVSIRVNPLKWVDSNADLSPGMPVPWAKHGYYLNHRPVFTLDPWLHAGAYYVQEASSMFLEQAVHKVLQEIDIQYVLDLCAAPGGKSTHLLGCLEAQTVLVSNEVVGARAGILVENLTKWGNSNSIVTQNDPSFFGGYEGLFDLLVVDAPCSGSGLFRREPGLVSEWSPAHVDLCSQRQKRILADVLPALAPGGFLLYSTCSYSAAEDENIIDWLSGQFNLEGVDIEWADNQYGVVVSKASASGIPCYRFFPDRVKGEGFFMALLRKPGTHLAFNLKQPKGKMPDVSMPSVLNDCIRVAEPLFFHRHDFAVYAMPEKVYMLFQHLRGKLNIRKAGVKVGDLMHGKLNPAHDLALSGLLQKGAFFPIDADRENALNYLRRAGADFGNNFPSGWLLVCYKDLPLGFVKNIGSRLNNYYPKDWRIRMA